MSRLETNSVVFRKTNIARNDYNYDNEYNVGNPDALSTGDEKGKGEFNGQIGGATDILERKKQLARNKYSNTQPYNDGNA